MTRLIGEDHRVPADQIIWSVRLATGPYLGWERAKLWLDELHMAIQPCAITEETAMIDDQEAQTLFRIAHDLIAEKQYAYHDDDAHRDAVERFSLEMRARYVQADDGDFETYMQDRMAYFETQWFEFEKADMQ
jgi:hypothetical protein